VGPFRGLPCQVDVHAAASTSRERARCRNAITMASVMVDEIRLRPTPARSDEPEP
jgi:hypothetical protein